MPKVFCDLTQTITKNTIFLNMVSGGNSKSAAWDGYKQKKLVKRKNWDKQCAKSRTLQNITFQHIRSTILRKQKQKVKKIDFHRRQH